jgi:hypothetical protein
MARVRDLQSGKTELTKADLTNRLTWERNTMKHRLKIF